MRVMLRFLFCALFCLPLVLITLAQGVRAVVVNEFANVRLTPALGAEVIATVSAGHLFDVVTARSGDNQWIRVIYFDQEAWVNLSPLRIISGDLNSLPTADPRSIPYGGLDAPRAGQSNATSPVQGRALDNVRIRSGPSRGYPMLANIFYKQTFAVTGRTASNRWLQVSFEGTLGWISATYAEIISGSLDTLPIDGIVADAAPRTGRGVDDFTATMRMLLDRLQNAQPSLDTIRAYWTDAALNGRAACGPYPARPTGVSIATPLLAAYYATLEPLRVDFNDAMANLRLAIDLFIEVCNQPGTGNPVGRATVQGALDVVNRVDSQFQQLRARISAFLPDLPEGACQLIYNGRSEVLPVIKLNTIYRDTFTPRYYASGYCFEAQAGQVLNVQTIQLPKSNLTTFLAISPLDTPQSFLAVARVGVGERLSISPINIERTTRYVLILADTGDGGRIGGPSGNFAFVVSDITGQSVTYIYFDPTTQSVLTTQDPTVAGVAETFTGDVFTAATPAAPQVTCPSTAFTCAQLFTCAEAQACLAAGNFALDPDNDGIPCEGILCN